MAATSDARGDLGYVRDVLKRSERTGFPAGIAYLWAAIGLVGFSLIDFAPERVGLYWSIASPAGFLLNAWLGVLFALGLIASALAAGKGRGAQRG